MKKILFLLICLCVSINVKALEDLAPNSKSAILIETTTGKIIYEKNSHEKLAPASMTKIMSMLLIMEEIDKGNLSFEDDVVISENAANMGGSQVFLEAGETYKVKDLLKGIAIASGNDAVVAMSEKISGTTDEFVKLMNKRAKELGLKDTVFLNPHGLDTDGHYSSAYDMSIMAKELLKHEEILKYTSVYEDYLKKNDGSSTWLVNTNKLVRFYDGVDGLKTGFTENAGYCLTATAKKNNMRLISVVMGVETSDLRSKDTTNLLNYGFNTYNLNVLVDKDSIIGETKIKNGKEDSISLKLKDSITILRKNNKSEEKYTKKIVLNNKLKAPIKVGDKVGKLEILDNNNKLITEGDITITKNVKKASYFDYLIRNIKISISGI